MPALSIDDAYRRYFALIRAKCGRMLSSTAEAEELAQETFLRLWSEGAHKLDERAALAWMYKTATRMAIDRLRSRKVRDRFAQNAPLGTVPAAEISFVRDALVRLVGSVDGEALEVAVLCRADGMSQPAAALVLGLSERTVRRRLEDFDQAAAPLRKEWLS